MSAGIDIKFIRDYYQKMTDNDIRNLLSQKLNGLTTDALQIIKEEIERRNLNPDLFEHVASQQEDNYEVPDNVFDPDGCPVDELTRIWLEKSFQILLKIFGKENTKNRKILTPESIHFPIRYDGSQRSAFETLKIIANQMEVQVEQIALDFYDENLRQITEGTPGGMYWGKAENEKFEISLSIKQLEEPENMVATLAHEIAHIKLLGENRIEENDEPLTDLATVFFGLGIFNANAAFRSFNDFKYYGWSQAGYLTQMEWGYALALLAKIREEKQPDWINYLCKNVKADFIRGETFISENESMIFQSR